MQFFLQRGKSNQWLVSRDGFTLIEVLAALVLLSVLLVGIVSARGKYVYQSHVVACKREAIATVDELLSSWWSDEEHVIKAGQRGRLLDGEKMQLDWRGVRVARVKEMDELLKGEVLCLEVVDRERRDSEDEVVLSVDLVVSDLSVITQIQDKDAEEKATSGDDEGGQDEE